MTNLEQDHGIRTYMEFEPIEPLKKKFILVRGLPGSGKTTVAKMFDTQCIAAADDFFVGEDGEYCYVGEKIGAAHLLCKGRVFHWMVRREPLIVVHNTFSMNWEMKDYFELAEEYGYEVHVVESQSGLSVEELAERNVHGVPVEAIARMKARWEALVLPGTHIR